MTDLKPGVQSSETYLLLAAMAAVVAAPIDFAWPLAVLGSVCYVARQAAKAYAARGGDQ
jgi:hypothetical protein